MSKWPGDPPYCPWCECGDPDDETSHSDECGLRSIRDEARAEGERAALVVRAEPVFPHQGQPFRGKTTIPKCVLEGPCPVCGAIRGALCFNPETGHPWATTAHHRRGTTGPWRPHRGEHADRLLAKDDG